MKNFAIFGELPNVFGEFFDSMKNSLADQDNLLNQVFLIYQGRGSLGSITVYCCFQGEWRGAAL